MSEPRKTVETMESDKSPGFIQKEIDVTGEGLVCNMHLHARHVLDTAQDVEGMRIPNFGSLGRGDWQSHTWRQGRPHLHHTQGGCGCHASPTSPIGKPKQGRAHTCSIHNVCTSSQVDESFIKYLSFK